MLFVKENSALNNAHKIFIALIYAVFFVSYYIFCFQFPFVCTENIRYAVPLIILGAFFTGTCGAVFRQSFRQKI